jgi:soluble lytic murein transglycosylase-like protein
MRAVLAAILLLQNMPQHRAKTYASAIVQESKRYRFDPLLVVSVVYHESRFNPRACTTGSHGLMQVQLKPRSCAKTRALARAQGLFKPSINIKRGMKLMSWWRGWCQKHHAGHDHHWLLHYNQGFGKCPKTNKRCKLRERIPITTGRVGGYAKRVLALYERIKKGVRKKRTDGKGITLLAQPAMRRLLATLQIPGLQGLRQERVR